MEKRKFLPTWFTVEGKLEENEGKHRGLRNIRDPRQAFASGFSEELPQGSMSQRWRKMQMLRRALQLLDLATMEVGVHSFALPETTPPCNYDPAQNYESRIQGGVIVLATREPPATMIPPAGSS